MKQSDGLVKVTVGDTKNIDDIDADVVMDHTGSGGYGSSIQKCSSPIF